MHATSEDSLNMTRASGVLARKNLVPGAWSLHTTRCHPPPLPSGPREASAGKQDKLRTGDRRQEDVISPRERKAESPVLRVLRGTTGTHVERFEKDREFGDTLACIRSSALKHPFGTFAAWCWYGGWHRPRTKTKSPPPPQLGRPEDLCELGLGVAQLLVLLLQPLLLMEQPLLALVVPKPSLGQAPALQREVRHLSRHREESGPAQTAILQCYNIIVQFIVALWT